MRIQFKGKLLIFVLTVVLLPIAILAILFMLNFNSITRISLGQNASALKTSNREFLGNLSADKSRLISLQLKNAVNSITVLGKSAQKLIDNYAALSRIKDAYTVPLFRDDYLVYNRALTNAKEHDVNILIPPPVADTERAKEYLKVSSFLNLLIGPVFESNENNAFVYFIGDKESPVTRAFPNINVAEVLGKAIEMLFWRDFFPDNVKPWEIFYTDTKFQKRVLSRTGSPVTFDPPYEDAAGQGKVITLFYPLWNKSSSQFAGVVAADISLKKIVENILSIQVAETGFAVLINGKGEIIAMPKKAESLLKVTTKKIERGGLKYFYQSLSTTADRGFKSVYSEIMGKTNGYLSAKLDDGENHIIVHSTIDSINDKDYNQDTWKIIISVPEREILKTLFDTHKTIVNANSRTVLLSSSVIGGVIILCVFFTFLISGRITKNIRQLGYAAAKISKKDYSIDLKIKAKDEIGELGSAFNQMSKEIKQYTENLEGMVMERTEELQNALKEISVLNEKLKDENLRLSAELDVAKKLQLMVLPQKKELDEIKDLDIACCMNPADEVGGDYYDIIQSDGSVKIGIGDVTGHGLPAGVIMLMAQTAIKTLVTTGEKDLKRIMSQVNSVLYSNIMRITEDKSMTLSLIDYKNSVYTLVGQHEHVIICRKNGTLDIKDTIDLGMYIGLTPDINEYLNQISFSLESGDILIFFTDGVTEAVNPSNEEFGIERICETLGKNYTLPAKGILDAIILAHDQFRGTQRVMDDISLVVIKQK